MNFEGCALVVKLNFYCLCITFLLVLVSSYILFIESSLRAIAVTEPLPKMVDIPNAEHKDANKAPGIPIVQKSNTVRNIENQVVNKKLEGFNIKTKLGVGVHLASYRTTKNANEGWNAIFEDHLDVLGSFKMVIRKINLGVDKGIYYRVLAIDLPDMATASLICTELRVRGQYCDPMTVPATP